MIVGIVPLHIVKCNMLKYEICFFFAFPYDKIIQYIYILYYICTYVYRPRTQFHLLFLGFELPFYGSNLPKYGAQFGF